MNDRSSFLSCSTLSGLTLAHEILPSESETCKRLVKLGTQSLALRQTPVNYTEAEEPTYET
jgi:hypothetical protein